MLPLAHQNVSCTFMAALDDSIEQYLSLDQHLIKHPTSTFFVRARGECMRETIQDGDLIIIDRSLNATSGKIVLAVVEGEFTLKRYFEEEGGKVVRLKPDNPQFQDIVIQNELQIWGVVTYIIHKAY